MHLPKLCGGMLIWFIPQRSGRSVVMRTSRTMWRKLFLRAQARHAASLSRHKSLTGWLYTSTHFAAAKMMRGENRRREREEKFMREPSFETSTETDWGKIRPVLDDAMHKLKAADREAILLRYFENQPFTAVGATLDFDGERRADARRTSRRQNCGLFSPSATRRWRPRSSPCFPRMRYKLPRQIWPQP